MGFNRDESVPTLINQFNLKDELLFKVCPQMFRFSVVPYEIREAGNILNTWKRFLFQGCLGGRLDGASDNNRSLRMRQCLPFRFRQELRHRNQGSIYGTYVFTVDW